MAHGMILRVLLALLLTLIQGGVRIPPVLQVVRITRLIAKAATLVELVRQPALGDPIAALGVVKQLVSMGFVIVSLVGVPSPKTVQALVQGLASQVWRRSSPIWQQAPLPNVSRQRLMGSALKLQIARNGEARLSARMAFVCAEPTSTFVLRRMAAVCTRLEAQYNYLSERRPLTCIRINANVQM